MDRITHPPSTLVRSAAVALLALVMIRWGNTIDLLSGITKPVVVALLGLAGFTTIDTGTGFTIGRLNVPWSGDCAGLNIFALLFLISLWVNRKELLGPKHLRQLALVLPAAFAANLARILSLTAYRAYFFPAVEGPQLHYFLGFLWLLPVLPILLRNKDTRPLEILHLAVVLALLTPLAPGPGGLLVIACTLLTLPIARRKTPARPFVAALWMLAALPILMTRMESLWLPWILSCPILVSWPTGWRLLLRLLLLVWTVPMASLQPWTFWPGVGLACLATWELVRPSAALSPAPNDDASGPLTYPTLGAAIGVLLVLPLFADSLSIPSGYKHVPPPGLMSLPLAHKTHRLHLLGTPPNIDILWFEPQGAGRHHTMTVCMRYRGVHLVPSDEPEVMTDGPRWMREFFFQEGHLVATYPSYLKRTFWPMSDPGVHVIVLGDSTRQSASVFKTETDSIANHLAKLIPQ